MTTFTYDFDGNKAVRVTIKDGFLLVAFLAFYTTLLTLNYTNSIEFLDSDFTIFNIGIRYLLVYSIAMVIFSVCFNFLFRNQLWNIVMKIDKIDGEVSLRLFFG